MLYLTNAFSINMLFGTKDVSFRVIPVSEAKLYLQNNKFVSAIGHKDTARVVGNILNMDIEPNRASITLCEDDTLIVAQYTGPRLPEGATTLPDGAKITFWKVEII